MQVAHFQRTKSRPVKVAVTLACALTVAPTSRAQVPGFRFFVHLPFRKQNVLVDTRLYQSQVWSLQEGDCFRRGTIPFGKSSRPSRALHSHGSSLEPGMSICVLVALVLQVIGLLESCLYSQHFFTTLGRQSFCEVGPYCSCLGLLFL